MAYLLDANVFIQAKNLHYGFDFCPAFWDWLSRANEAGSVFSIEKVGSELRAGSDPLAEWAEAKGSAFFLSPDSSVLPALTRVSAWAAGQSFTPAAVSTFLDVADYWLVAQGLAGTHVVVTHERPSDGLRQIKIPNACIGLGVAFMTPYEMLRRERSRFVLGPT